MPNCKHCKPDKAAQFCSSCGAHLKPKRIDAGYVVQELKSILYLEFGIFYTIKELALRPGKTTKRYLWGERKRFIKPILFLIVCSLVYTLGQRLFDYEILTISFSEETKKSRPLAFELLSWFTDNYGYLNVWMALFIAAFYRLFFRRINYNYFEIFVFLCYILGLFMLFYFVLGLVDNLVGLPFLQIGLPLSWIYLMWAVKQFYLDNRKRVYIKAILGYSLGTFTSLLLFVAISMGLDLLLGS
ncbi:DUF3667 domain-containing protein [Mesonia sediminis]|uniref:DUF3667 domain-containing protein n=1 Tax=Mesonia sediminis TaxID=1703946 RepID=A0ABW5SCY2_9FLAO